MTDAWQSINLQEFEHVLAGPSTALLRLRGKSTRRRSASDRRPILAVMDDQGTHRFVAIPSPPDERGIMRAAYSVPAGLIQATTSFSLELSDGSSLPLPAPTPGAARFVGETETAAPEAAEAANDVAPDGGERRSELIDKVAQLSAALAEAERAGTAHAAAREAAEAEATGAREELTAIRAAADADSLEARELLESLQQRAKNLEDAALQAQVQADERVAEVEHEAAGARELNETLEQRNVQLDKSAREYQERVQSLERDLSAAAGARTDIEAEIGSLRAAQSQHRKELEQARDQVRIMTLERDELTRQAAAFDDVAIKARDRATQAEAGSQKSESMLAELQTWRAELERRLAAITTELAASKAARQESDRELERTRDELTESEAKLELARAEIQRLSQEGASEAGDGSPAVDDAALMRVKAELEQLRAAHAPPTPGGGDDGSRARALETRRREIADQAEQLADLLAPAAALVELASELSQARERAEDLRAVTSSPLPETAGALPAADSESGSATADGAGVPVPGDDDGRAANDGRGSGAALAAAQAEIQALRAKLDRAHATNETDQLELIRLSAEADARVQAERELSRARGLAQSPGDA